MRLALTAALFLALTLVSCEFDPFSASRTVKFELAADGVRKLMCQTHNGAIVVRPGTHPTIRGEVELTARGPTEEAAAARAALMEPAPRRDGDALVLAWRWSDGAHGDWSGDAAFRIEVPAGLAAALETHSGPIDASGLAGAGEFASHNGDMKLAGAFDEVRIRSHNANVGLQVSGTGSLTGDIRSHNGEVEIDLGQRAAHVTVDTHNGKIVCTREGETVQKSESHLELRVGNSERVLQVETHNGGVAIR